MPQFAVDLIPLATPLAVDARGETDGARMGETTHPHQGRRRRTAPVDQSAKPAAPLHVGAAVAARRLLRREVAMEARGETAGARRARTMGGAWGGAFPVTGARGFPAPPLAPANDAPAPGEAR